MRDLGSFLKHDVSEMNPLLGQDGRPVARRVIGGGRSQSGRAIRMFLYEGFNGDEQGRQVFDGLIPTVAGGGQGFFNHRFASPTRTSTQHNGHLYPVDVFPFTYGDETDPFSNRRDSILGQARASNTVPKLMHLDTASEYWHRSASLVVTDPLGTRDSEIPPEVRVYVFGGAQHSPARGPSNRGQQQPNPTDYGPFQEALFLAMDRWITEGTPPPPSVYPRVTDGTLVGSQSAQAGWVPIPGVRYPTVIQQPEHLDYGPEFHDHRRIDHHPPVRTGEHYRVLVPAHDEDNNERGVLKLPSVANPVATHTGWSLRHPNIGAEDEMLRLTGSYIPFPRSAAERTASGDPRQAVMERYRDFDDYLSRTMAVAEQLLSQGYLLPETPHRRQGRLAVAPTAFRPVVVARTRPTRVANEQEGNAMTAASRHGHARSDDYVSSQRRGRRARIGVAAVLVATGITLLAQQPSPPPNPLVSHCSIRPVVCGRTRSSESRCELKTASTLTSTANV